MHFKIYRSESVAVPVCSDGARDIDKRRLKKPKGDSFWDNFGRAVGRLDVSSGIGCYLFSVKASKGEMPWYVGKAANQSFEQECFGVEKQRKLNSMLIRRRKGTLHLTLFLMVTERHRRLVKPIKPRGTRPERKGRRCKCRHRSVGEQAIEFLERLLIAECYDRNPNLINSAGTRFLTKMNVPGLLNDGRGKPSKVASEVRRLLGRSKRA